MYSENTMRQNPVYQTRVWMLALISMVAQASASEVLGAACQTELESLCGVIRLPSGQEIQLVPVSEAPLHVAQLGSFGRWNFVCTFPNISGSMPSPSLTSSDPISTSPRIKLTSTLASTPRESTTFHKSDVSASNGVTTATDESTSGSWIQKTAGDTTHISIHTLLSAQKTTLPTDSDAQTKEWITVLTTPQSDSDELEVTGSTSTTLKTDLSSSTGTTPDVTVGDHITHVTAIEFVLSTEVENGNTLGSTHIRTTAHIDPGPHAMESTTVLGTTRSDSDVLGVTEVTSATLKTDMSSSVGMTPVEIVDLEIELPQIGPVPSTEVDKGSTLGTTPEVTTVTSRGPTLPRITGTGLSTTDESRTTLEPSITVSETNATTDNHSPSQNNLTHVTAPEALTNKGTTSHLTTGSEMSTTDKFRLTSGPPSTLSETDATTADHVSPQSTRATIMTSTPDDADVTTDDYGPPQSTSTHATTRISTQEDVHTSEGTTKGTPERTTPSRSHSTLAETDVTTRMTTPPVTTEQSSTPAPTAAKTSTEKTTTEEKGEEQATESMTSSTGTCPVNFVSFENKCYYFLPALPTSYMTHVDAEDYCFSLSTGFYNYATLLTINSAEENQFLMNYLSTYVNVNILNSDGVWVNCDLGGRFYCTVDYGNAWYLSSSNRFLDYGSSSAGHCVILSLYDGDWYGIGCTDSALVVCQFSL